MTGKWTDEASGQSPLYWTLTDNGGVLSGSATETCGTGATWPNVQGTYSPATGAYTIKATNGTPKNSSCGGRMGNTADQSVMGTIGGNGICGVGAGTYQGGVSGANAIYVAERVPGGETSQTYSVFMDNSGLNTTAIFYGSLTLKPGDPVYNFGGRIVQELIPSAAQTPAGFQGSDGCWWPNGPYTQKVTSLITKDFWNVQSTGPNGSYAPDYIGLAGETLANVQTYSPAVMANGSCTIQYPQMMTIKRESDFSNARIPYGAANTGLNLLKFVIGSTSISASRGAATASRTFHF